MGRRGRSASPSRSPVRSPTRSRAPAPVSTRARAPASAARAQPPAPVNAPASAVGAPKGPGLMGQMAAMAGGVAVGSAVGHTVGHMITGDSNHGDAPEQQSQGEPQFQQQQGWDCQLEMKQFVDCAQNQSDLSLCDGFNQVLRDCKSRYGGPPAY